MLPHNNLPMSLIALKGFEPSTPFQHLMRIWSLLYRRPAARQTR
jgi:hypothetical protein